MRRKVEAMGTISVVIPVYNGMKTLAAAVESAIAQTYSIEEIIIVDDGSTDETSEVARSLTEKSPCVRYLGKKNEGVSLARNLGIEQASGEWIAFLDADDTWDPRKLETQINALANAPDCCASYTGMWAHDLKSGEVTVYRAKTYGSLLERLRYGNCGIGASTLMVRRSSLREIGGFDPAFNGNEDWDLVFRLLVRGNKILPVGDPLIHYTVALGSLSTSDDMLKQDLNLLNTGKLLVGLRGWKKFYMRRKIRAEIYCRAGINSRTRGDLNDALLRFVQSAASWPTRKGVKAGMVTAIRCLNTR
jgi:glycosyltransferase involved in cell wall biosynthesis